MSDFAMKNFLYAEIAVSLNITQKYINEGATLTDLCVTVSDPRHIPLDGFVSYFITTAPGTAAGTCIILEKKLI